MQKNLILLLMYQHICSSAFNLVLGRSISIPGEETLCQDCQIPLEFQPNMKKTNQAAYHATSFRVQLQNTAHDGYALPQEEPMTAASGDTVTYLEQVSHVCEPKSQKKKKKEDNNQIVMELFMLHFE